MDLSKAIKAAADFDGALDLDALLQAGMRLSGEVKSLASQSRTKTSPMST